MLEMGLAKREAWECGLSDLASTTARRRRKFFVAYAILCFCIGGLLPTSIAAHPEGLAADGCHNDRKMEDVTVIVLPLARPRKLSGLAAWSDARSISQTVLRSAPREPLQ